MNTNTIILVVAAGAIYFYLRGRRSTLSAEYTGPPAVITNESTNLAERVSGSVLKRQAIRSRDLPRPNENVPPTGSSAADRMNG
jgi:hypothetical protein